MFRPRKGQQDLIEFLPKIRKGDQLSVQWPTGYGKSIGFGLAWKHCVETGIANRLLLVVANDTQRAQIINDFASECSLVGAPCRGGVWYWERSGADLGAAKDHKADVFVCTVHALEASHRGGVNTLKDLLTIPGTKWMVGFDEFHHYGEAMPWGDAAKAAMVHASFSLAMSATPYRRGADTIFAKPDLEVSYSDAVDEVAVKKMICHSYEYKVTVQEGDSAVSYTTSELIEEAKDGIDQWEERRSIRYLPEYIHPLLANPITRLRQIRIRFGRRIQMLVRAMSCSHARMVCEQVRLFAEDLVVDWIGTGPHGRSEQENSRIRAGFCPPKKNGVRPEPEIDILVQVSMAGEGFDSINVAEIVDLYPVSSRAATGRATADKQFYGRGSRIIPGCAQIQLHVNVPSDHPLHKRWGGKTLHTWMDACGEEAEVVGAEPDVQPPEFDPFDFPDLPKEREVELIEINTEDPHFKAFAVDAAKGWEHGRMGWKYADVADPEFLSKAMEWYRGVHRVCAEQESAKSRHVQVKEAVESIVGRIAYVLAKRDAGLVFDRGAIGRKKKEINRLIVKNIGAYRDDASTELLESAYSWLRKYLKSLGDGGER